MNKRTSRTDEEGAFRIWIIASLLIGITAAVALLIASTWVSWLAWVALGVAVGAGIAATWVAVLAKRAQRIRLLASAQAERRDHRVHLRESHASQREVLAVIDAQTHALRDELADARSDLGERRMEVSRLRGDIQALRVENTELKEQVEVLRATTNEGAEVLSLPRRRVSDVDEAEWWVGEAPTLIELGLQRAPLEEFPQAEAN